MDKAFSKDPSEERTILNSRKNMKTKLLLCAIFCVFSFGFSQIVLAGDPATVGYWWTSEQTTKPELTKWTFSLASNIDGINAIDITFNPPAGGVFNQPVRSNTPWVDSVSDEELAAVGADRTQETSFLVNISSVMGMEITDTTETLHGAFAISGGMLLPTQIAQLVMPSTITQPPTVQGFVATGTGGKYALERITGLSITTAPVAGEVFVDKVSWGTAPQNKPIGAGTYVISFGPVAGFQTPADQTITIDQNQTQPVQGIYLPVAENGNVIDTPTQGGLCGSSGLTMIGVIVLAGLSLTGSKLLQVSTKD